MLATTLIFATLSVWFRLFFAEQTNITAEPGHDVTLPCRAVDDEPILVVEWDRTDLGSEYVLSYRDEQFDQDHQHPSFHQRVDLQDRQMKDGDVSLILKNVTTHDTGTYECRIFQREKGKRLADTKIICINHLKVLPSARRQDGGDEDGGDKNGGNEVPPIQGHYGLIGGVSAVGILVLVGVVFWIFKKKNSAPPPHMI